LVRGLHHRQGATNNRIEGNYVGTDASGTQKLRNELYGVVIMSAPGNVVGGAVSGAGNVISGNGEQGVLIRSSGATNNTIEGNYIGTDTTGVQDLGNGQFGVFVSTSDNTIGKGNTIAHNPSGGIRISSSRNKVKGNVIKANGGSGVDLIPNIFSPTNDNVIGGTTSADANVIHDNVGAGVQLRIFADTSSAGNSVLTNSIFANGGLGIGLNGFNFPGNNDEDDPDSGINNGQNYPVITSATRDSASGETTITGMLNSNPDQTYTIQCFKADAEVRNHGEGETFLAETTAATDANGDATFTFTTIEDALAVGDEVTSTATNTSGSAANTRIGDTSQFSRNLFVTAGP
jgi:Periplasmic copper-binding protein (NosD)